LGAASDERDEEETLDDAQVSEGLYIGWEWDDEVWWDGDGNRCAGQCGGWHYEWV
jgi:hypothetical protein